MSGTRARYLLLGLALMAAAHCGKKSSNPLAPSSASLTSLTIAGNPTLKGIGQTAQFSATAKFSDGTSQDVTSKATWQSGNTSDVTVSGSGLVTGTGYGETTLSAAYQGMSGNMTVATVLIDLTGTWKGTGESSDGVADFTATLTQAATSVSGNATFTVIILTGTGTFTGSVNPAGTNVNFVIDATGKLGSTTCTVKYTGTAQLTGVTLTGTYAGTNSCTGAVTDGHVTLTKQ